MAFTTTQLAALERAIGTGELSIEYDGKKVQYRNMDDLIKAYNLVKSHLIAEGSLASPSLSNRGPASVGVFSRD